MQLNKPIFKFSELETERLFLRKYRKEDALDIFEMYNDNEVMKFAGPDRHLIIEDTEKFIEKVLSDIEQKKDIFWAIVLKSQNKVIGDISLCSIDFKHAFAFFGIFLLRKHWRQGFMFEAAKPVIKFAFEELALNRIEGQVFINNISSIKIFEKLEFQREAELRGNFLIDGKYQNSYVYSMIRNDYEINSYLSQH